MLSKHDKMQMLPTLLEESSWNSARMAWLKKRDKITSFLFTAVLYGFFLWGFASGWQILSIWLKIIIILSIPGMLLLFLSLVRDLPRGSQQVRTGMLALRQAAEDGDELIAPLAAEQPAALPSAEFAITSERICLFGGWFSSAGGVAGIGVGLLLFSAGYAILLVTLLGSSPLNDPNTAPLIILLILLILFGFAAGVCGAGGIIALLSVYSIRRHAYVVADESGVRWWRRAWGKHSRHSISWYTVRSFFMIVYPGKEEGKHYTIYALDAHDVLLLWHISHRTRPRVLAAHERFCRLIVTRTKLPLRDLSAAVEKLVSIDEPSSDERQPVLAVSQAQGAEDE